MGKYTKSTISLYLHSEHLVDYLRFMASKNNTIDAGKVAPVKQTESSGSSAVVTPEESRVSIERKFQQLQAAYPPNQGVTWTGSYGGCTECFGFARFAFNKLFDCNMPSSYYNSRRYEYANNNNVVKLGQLAGSSAVTEAAVEELLSQALLGDILQVCGASQHTMMVVGVSDEGITVYDCNWDGACGIYQRTISFASFAEKYSAAHAESESGVTLYRAANYDTLYWDGTDVFFDDSVNFVIENGVLVKYNGKRPYIVIPEEVTAIGTKAFYDNDYLLGVTMGDAVESIEERAFYDCDNLLYCNFSSALESVGTYAFYSCDSLSSARLPDGVMEVPQGAFSNCTSLTKVTLPSTVKTLGALAFEKTGISEISIPKSLKSCGSTNSYQGKGPFSECEQLRTIIFEEGTEKITGRLLAGCTGIKEITIPNSVTTISEFAFSSCTNLKKVVFGKNVETIEPFAFNNCKALTELTLPETLTTMGNYAFSDCTSLTEITIPSSLTEIPQGAFSNCTSFTKVTVPRTVAKIASNAFTNAEDLTIYGYTNSYAETFANEHNIPFVALEEESGTSSITVSGTVTGYGSEAGATDDVTIELWAERATEATYTTTVTGNTATYSIENVEPGTYTMKVSKPGHITREYTVVVADSVVTQDATICPKGDVNLDGEVNADDLTALARHVAKIETLSDPYALLCADVDDNGSLSADDLTKLARYVAKIIPYL